MFQHALITNTHRHGIGSMLLNVQGGGSTVQCGAGKDMLRGRPVQSTNAQTISDRLGE